jgi:two-component system sensor histidine kinase QseC
MSRLVSQLLALSRLDATGTAPFRQRIDWSIILGAALSDVLPLAEERRIEIEVQWQAEPRDALPLLASPDLVAAALRNLLDNALRYSPTGSRVTVVCQTDAISILDEGSGVTEALLPRLEDRFFRAGGADTAGSGLGLSIVNRIAGLHGLTLTLANRPGGGFRASLRRATVLQL